MIILILSYIVLAALLLNLGLRSPWSKSIKLAAIVITTGFYFITYHALNDLAGWPSNDGLPERFKILSIYTNEQSENHKGIYLWVQDLNTSDALPRAYQLPYDNETHKIANKVAQKRQQGEIVTARKAGGQEAGAGVPSAAFRLIKPPTPILPEKNTQNPG